MVEVPRNALTRGVRLAALPASYAGRAALGVGKRLGGASADEVTAELQARMAEQMFSVLGELKGGAMKVGQALSVFEAALPPEFTEPYRAMLVKLQDSAPPMSAQAVDKIMSAEMGPEWRSRFAEFDDVPVGAASIGQVHRGVWHDGRVVAIKLQYPGADKALRSDLNQMARMGKLFGSWLPGLDIGPIVDELRDRATEELDYLRESNNQRAFAAAYEDDPDFIVPHVLAAAPHILISEWVDGTPLSAVIAEGSPEQRDLVGLQLMRFLLSGPARAGLLHADPHPGNFKVADDGRLIVLDFGAVDVLPDGLPRAMGHLIRIAMDGDANTVLEGLRAEGFVKSNVDLDPQRLLAYLDPFVESAKVEQFTYSREWLRGQFERLNDISNPDFTVGLRLNLPPSYVLIHRVWMGTIGVLCQLGATVPMQAELAQWLPGFTDDLHAR